MSLSIKLSTFVSGGFTGDVMRWRLKESGTQIYIDQHEEPGPHGTVYNFSFVNNIRDIVYTVELYDVPPGGGVGNLVKSHDVTPSTQSFIFDADIELKVDGGETYDPVDGASSVVIPQLIGKAYRVVQRTIGPLLKTRDIEFIADTVNGGFQLTNSQVFYAGDIFVIEIQPGFVINPPGSVTVGPYKDVVLIQADYTVLPADYGKLLVVEGAGARIALTLPDPATISEKIPLYIESVGTNHINMVINPFTGYTIISNGIIDVSMILGRAERAEIIKLQGQVYGLTDSHDMKRAGQFEWGYSQRINRLMADGAEYDIDDYPRIKKAINNGWVRIVPYTAWDNVDVDGNFLNRGVFAYSAGSTFRVPDLRNKFIRSLKFLDGSEDTERNLSLPGSAGGLQLDMIKAHSHRVNTSGTNNTDPFMALKRTGNVAGDGYNNPSSPTIPPIEVTGGIETRPINIGLIPLIII